ncbi:hypothetical protein RIF29_09112 [Crotalaria pallida]|uniref:Uncharacterized protein n=1 Tax=Crotalaria pallida TaxID=3830 RepID=A0AAN9FU78_CROPI
MASTTEIQIQNAPESFCPGKLEVVPLQDSSLSLRKMCLILPPNPPYAATVSAAVLSAAALPSLRSKKKTFDVPSFIEKQKILSVSLFSHFSSPS